MIFDLEAMKHIRKFLSKTILWKPPGTIRKWLECAVLWAVTIWTVIAFVLFTGWWVVWFINRYPM